MIAFAFKEIEEEIKEEEEEEEGEEEEEDGKNFPGKRIGEENPFKDKKKVETLSICREIGSHGCRSCSTVNSVLNNFGYKRNSFFKLNTNQFSVLLKFLDASTYLCTWVCP